MYTHLVKPYYFIDSLFLKLNTEGENQVDTGSLSMEELAGKVGADASGALGVLLAYLGDQTGVYKSLEESGPISCADLASKTGLDGRYLQEFLSANAAHGYVTYDNEANAFSMSDAQAAIFAHEGEPTCMQGFFQAIVSQYATHDLALETFKSGNGRPWNQQHACCFCGTDRFFRPGYEANLLDNWIPSLDGVHAKLVNGARIADIGCGHGSSTIMMAKQYPHSTFYGFDFHDASIDEARKKAAEEGVDNVLFEVYTAKDIPDNQYDFACIFDALHDMGDPVGAASRIRQVLAKDGTFMLVEPMAEDSLQANLEKNPMCGAYYSFSTLVCVPTSKSQEVGLALGAQAGQSKLTEVLSEAGFSKVRRTSETPSNIVLEVQI